MCPQITQYDTSYYFDGYIADAILIDGQALEPYYFGNNDANGVWKPIQYKGTYGTNGFYLPFTSNTSTTAYASYTTDSSVNYVSLPTGSQGSNFTFTGDFTIEGWFLPVNAAAETTFYVQGTTTYLALNIDINAGTYAIYLNSATITSSISSGIILGNWTHVAMVRKDGVITLYTNGIAKGTISNTSTLGYSTLTYNRFGGGVASTRYMSNVRIVKSAVYTSNFVPPTSALTNIANTVVLTFQNSSAIDNSSNAYTLTTTGSLTYPSGNAIFTANTTSDASGNANNWLPTNINYSTSGTTYDAMLDVPTNTSATVANYGTWNPLNAYNTTTSNGNLNFSMSANNTQSIQGTFGMNSGKWYFEYSFTSAGSTVLIGGIVGSEYTASGTRPYSSSTGYMYIGSSGNKINANTGASYGSTYTTNDVIGVAVDLDNGKIWFSKNGTWQASGDPAAGTNAAYTGLSGTYVPSVTNGNDGVTYEGWINCGQRPFSYTPPTGFVALNTYNLPTPTILQGNKYMDATLYTGNGSTQVIVNQGQFQPDLVWDKARSNTDTNSNMLVNSSTGRSKSLSSNQTSTEGTSSAGYDLVSFNSNGFTVGPASQGDFNTSGWTFVGWQWKANGGTTSSNTNGSITSTVQVNTTAGFSIVTYTGTGANATVGHGLGVAPKMIITRYRGIESWSVYHTSLGGTKTLYLDLTNAANTTSLAWNNTDPTSTVFSVGSAGTTNTSGGSGMLAYCWAEIAGFSKFGSYTGNGNSNGPFVYTGFRPKFVLIKCSTSGGTYFAWYILDSSRNVYNETNNILEPNSSAAESTIAKLDLLSNGFKLRDATDSLNGSGGTYIFAAFAENPFKNSNAR